MATQELFSGFSDTLDASVQRWHVPGCAAAVVNHDGLIWCDSSGVRDLERRLPFMSGTLFEVASLTKAFTAACLGILADRKVLTWDTPIRMYLPGFALMDAGATETITVRDILSHRTGLPRHDGVWSGRVDMTGPAIMESLRFLEPSCPPRTRFQYQNMMYAVAGLVVEALDGRTWKDFLQSELLGPLGMERTRLSRKAGLLTGDYAMPYRLQDNTPVRMSFEHIVEGLAPAGCIISTVEDMGKWLAFHLGDGTANGRRILSPETLAFLHEPTIVVTGDERCFVGLSELGEDSYCMGWHSQSYRGHRMLHHSGANDGLTSMALLFPDDDLGIVALTNSDDSMQRVAVALMAADRALSLDPLPWDDRYLERARAAQPPAFVPPAPADPGLPLSTYEGSYAHPAYGILSVTVEGNGLHLELHGSAAEAIGHAANTFIAVNGSMLDKGDLITFDVDASGSAILVAAPLEHAVSPIRFMRR